MENENQMFVENPLLMSGLFGQGVYLARDRHGESLEFTGAGLSGVLNVLHYPEYPKLPPKALAVLAKLMGAVTFNGKQLLPEEFSVINSGTLPPDKNLEDVIADFKPVKVIVWSDKWFADSNEVHFYKTGSAGNVEILRCHSLHTVLSDTERKTACWNAIRRYFGM